MEKCVRGKFNAKENLNLPLLLLNKIERAF